MATTTIKSGQLLMKRKNGTVREIVGFTTKPTPTSPSDGIRRARLIGTDNTETRVRVDQLTKTYQPV